jgi:hypothetical protein
MKVAYRDTALRGKTREVVAFANQIIADYQGQGLKLTLRQLYYRFVAAGRLENKDSEYKRLGEIITSARYGGLIDWDAIEDRTRNLYGTQHQSSPEQALIEAASDYRLDKWRRQKCRPEIWVEKEALAGIVQRAALDLDVNYMACRGYMSASEMEAAAQRFRHYRRIGQVPYVIHLGDHDPSGIDMSRDIKERIAEFMRHFGTQGIEFRRIALNMDQIRQYDPPPNPAKLTDSRCTGYIEQYGDESWELDALEPSVLNALMRDAVLEVRDEFVWEEALQEERDQRRKIATIAAQFAEIEYLAEEQGWEPPADYEDRDQDTYNGDEE